MVASTHATTATENYCLRQSCTLKNLHLMLKLLSTAEEHVGMPRTLLTFTSKSHILHLCRTFAN